jgi:hypothetical protein
MNLNKQNTQGDSLLQLKDIPFYASLVTHKTHNKDMLKTAAPYKETSEGSTQPAMNKHIRIDCDINT